MHQSIFEANLPEKPESITRKKFQLTSESCHSPSNKQKSKLGGGCRMVPVSIKFHDKFSILPILFLLIVLFDVVMSSNVAIAILLMAMILPCVSFFLRLRLL